MEENTGDVLLIKPATLLAESKAKLGGTLQVATLQLRWDPMHSSDHQPVSVQLSSVTGVLQRSKKSPMVRIPTRGGAVTLEFQSMPERDEVVDILTPLVKKVADKGKAPVGQPAQAAPQQAAPQLTGPPALVALKSKLLKKDKDLRHLFDELVRNGIISEGEFWKQRVHLLREAQGPTGSAKQRTGISNALLSRGTDAKGQQNKVTFKLNAEGIQQIFAEQPHVHKAYLDNVPHNLTEAAFWDRYFKNEFRMRALRRKAKAGDKTAALELADEDELFRNRGDAAQQELQQRHKVRRVDPTVNLAADSFDQWSHGFGLDHDPAKDVDPSVAQEGVGKHLLSELNRHADVVLQGLPTSVGTSANTEGLAQAMWEAQQVEAAAERSGRGNSDQHLTAEEQKAFRMRADGALGDLQAEDHQQFVELNIKDPRRYFEGKVVADGSQQPQVHGAPPAVLWQQALVSINPAQLQHGMTPQLTYQVMQDLYAEQTTLGLDETGLTVGTNPATDLAAPIQEECRRVCQTGNEMLRHFWASFPWTSKQREEKAAKLDRALASHYDRIMAMYDSSTGTERFCIRQLLKPLENAPPDAILGITEAFKKDTSPQKLNLGVGAYRTEDGKPLVLDVVKKAEQKIINDPQQNKEYLGIAGEPAFAKLSARLAFGDDSAVLKEGRNATMQCLSGTGSLRVGAEFLKLHYPVHLVYIPNPTWANHLKIFPLAGIQVRRYRYFSPKTVGLDYKGMLEDLGRAPQGSIVLLHACAHNPTGVDPTPEQWQGILKVVRERRLLPFLDSAYQGFASGDLDRDAQSIRMFADAGVEMLLAQSYAKNMGLYGERVGALSVVTSDPKVARKVESQLKSVIRPMYSNPPKHGSAIVTTILSDKELFSQWKVELKAMADRIITMRTKLHESLREINAPGSWKHIEDQIGMFAYTGLTKEQVQLLTDKYHIYMTFDGRISMAGLSAKTCPYLAKAMKDAVENVHA